MKNKSDFIEHLRQNGFKYMEANTGVGESDYYINKAVFVKFYDSHVKIRLIASTLGFNNYTELELDDFKQMIEFLLTIHE